VIEAIYGASFNIERSGYNRFRTIPEHHPGTYTITVDGIAGIGSTVRPN